ncbi:MAG: hypothetical protein K0R12_115 [Gammaproteobacteria bacterium]|nr:hypothetical protein [Gammaproteobacteria bacterium]
MGIEPTLSAWEADVLPLNYTRRKTHYTFQLMIDKSAPVYSGNL